MSDDAGVAERAAIFDDPALPSLTPAQQRLVERALPLVDRTVRHVLVRYQGLVTEDDLRGAGELALCGAAQSFDPSYANSFEGYARNRVHGAMLDHVRAEAMELKVQRAAEQVGAHFAAFLREDFDDLRDSRESIEKRFRSFVEKLFAATFAGGVEEAAKATSESELIVRQEYTRAIEVVGGALEKLPERERAVVRLLYGARKKMPEVMAELRIGIKAARLAEARALVAIKRELEAHGIRGVPEAPAGGGQVIALFDPGRSPGDGGPKRARDG